MCGSVCEERLGRKEEERERQYNCVGSKIMGYMAEELIRDLVKPNKIIDWVSPYWQLPNLENSRHGVRRQVLLGKSMLIHLRHC